MRLASESENFPYDLATVCYLEVDDRGKVTSPPGQGISQRVREGNCSLYAVWPGHYRSDLFLVDDIDEYEKALGLQHDPVRTGLEDHEHRIEWQISPSEQKPTGAYVLIEATLVCGCEIRDLKSFAGQMRVQRGWDVAVSGGWGGHASTYTFRVRRKSLG